MDFNGALRLEVDRILADPLFVRAPIQTRLLKFLRDHAIAGDHGLTQYTVAVDGLGRPEDFDLSSDSYPRVQVSRLRSNLASYYARNEPVEGGCVYIKPGDYRLRLGSRDQAYPDAVSRNSVAEAEPEPVPPPAVVTSPGPDQEPNGVAGSAAGADASEAPAAAAIPSEGENLTNSAVAQGSAAPPARSLPRGVFAGIAVIVTLALIAAVWWGKDRLLTEKLPGGPPAIVLSVFSDDSFAEGEQTAMLVSAAERIARNQLSRSFVSRLLAEGEKDDLAQYSIRLSMGSGAGNPDALLHLYNDENDLLYTATIPFSGDRELFLGEIEANLAYITAPNGLISRDQREKITEEPDTPYECFIVIEGSRAQPGAAFALIESCLERFPRDRFAAYWLARRSFMQYQQLLLQGQPVTRSGQAWEDNLAALKLDEHNPFANFMGAKVSFAEGDCSRARAYVGRALERGTSFPALLAAGLTEASGCPPDPETAQREEQTVALLLAVNPDPDPLLHLYLTLSLLARGQEDLAREATGRLIIGESQGLVEDTTESIRRSLADPDYFAANRPEIEQQIALFIWSENARRQIIAQLEG